MFYKKDALIIIFAIIFLSGMKSAFATCTIISNDYSTSNGFASPFDARSMGNSFTACQSGKISKIKVLSLDERSGITVTVYQGNGVNGAILGSLNNITLSNALSVTDYSEIDISSQNIMVTSGNQYTFVLTSAVKIYFNDSNDPYNDPDGSSMYIGGSYWANDGGFFTATGRDLYFEIDISDASLPVELVSFDAKPENNAVEMAWTTASEIDNLGFIIERRQNNCNWQQIASYLSHEALIGQGTSSSSKQYSYTDKDVTAGASYAYRLSDVDLNGNVTVLTTQSVKSSALPTSTQLYPAYPNPFNPGTTLVYQLATDGHVTLAVYDILGRQVRLLTNQQQTAGEYTTSWDGTTDAGLAAPSGTYLVRLQAGSFSKVRKIVLIK